MVPVACREPEHDTLTGGGITSVISYWPMGQRTCWHNARICLGESPAETYNRFDLCYSFKILCQAEYGGTRQLHLATKNYIRNYTARQPQNRRITYEQALWNLTVLMFSSLYKSHREQQILGGPLDADGARVLDGGGNLGPFPPLAKMGGTRRPG